VGRVTWAAPYESTARGLVAGLKFQRRPGLAAVAAEAIAAALGPGFDGWAVVAAPASPLRRRLRGFDPAESIAVALAPRLGATAGQPLRRTHGRRQVGKSRGERLAAGPRVWTAAAAPSRVLLVDDVLTTGATLGACALALRAAGSVELRAAVFARS